MAPDSIGITERRDNAMQPPDSRSRGLGPAQVTAVAEHVGYQDGAVGSREIVKTPAGSVTLFAFDEGQVGYQDGAVVSREIVKTPAGSVTLFAFDEGQGLSEHTVPFDALVQVVARQA